MTRRRAPPRPPPRSPLFFAVRQPDGQTVELVGDVLGTADLGGDGNPESVVLLAESSGGSGVQIYVAAVGRRRGKLVNLGTGRGRIQPGHVPSQTNQS